MLRTLEFQPLLTGKRSLLASPLLGDGLCFTAWLERLKR